MLRGRLRCFRVSRDRACSGSPPGTIREGEVGPESRGRLWKIPELERACSRRCVQPFPASGAFPVHAVEGAGAVTALYGVKCRKCGTPQIHPIAQNIRVCVACQAKDAFDEYRFSDKKGRLFTYAIDQLQPTKNRPGLNGVVDFDEGGRLTCELTDCEADKVRIGMKLEMTLRKLSADKGIINYFWKAKPAIE